MGKSRRGCGFNKKCGICFPVLPEEDQDGSVEPAPREMAYGLDGMGLRFRGFGAAGLALRTPGGTAERLSAADAEDA